MHAVGKPDLQRVRLAEALLLARRRLRANVRRTAQLDRLERLRSRQRQPEVPQLHDALRLRTDRRQRDVRLSRRAVRRRAQCDVRLKASTSRHFGRPR